MLQEIHFDVTARCLVALTIVFGVWSWSTAPAKASGDINRSDCSAYPGTEESVGFRATLPDCRALELVTPPYKGGQPAFGTRHRPPPISPDGNRLFGVDFAGFANTGNLENKGFEVGAIYSFARGSTGWMTEALEPSSEEAAHSEYITGSVNLMSSLWETTNQSQSREEVQETATSGYSLALRPQGSTGTFLRIGKLTPATSTNGSESVTLRGSSSNLSNVTFETIASSTNLWPGDTTQEGLPSLYEYQGVNQSEPVLVGVRNNGALNGVHVNEHADLISKCGTRLGSVNRGSTYNAVSGSGERIYFTALECPEELAGSGPEVAELYARTDRAETTPISEPTPSQCAACKVPATSELGRRGSIFEGAALDGSKAFFLSTQELLPGAEGVSLYEYDWSRSGGDHVVLVAPETLGVSRISQDGSHVYFVATPALASIPDGSLPLGHTEPVSGEPNLYVYDTVTGTTAFVATLSAGDEALWQHPDNARPVVSTTDGGFLLFRSSAALTSDDTGTVPQIFEYNASSDTLSRISHGQTSSAFPAGFGDDGNTTDETEAPQMLVTPQYQANTQPVAQRTGASIAATGAAVFTSRDALAPGAVKGRENIYEYREANVFLISPGSELSPLTTEESRLLGISESGGDVYFFAAEALLPEDVDTQADWYDAREGGGFPARSAVAACSGEACRQPFTAAPTPPLPAGSATAGAGDNLPPPAPIMPSTATKPKAKPPTRAQKLRQALHACREQPRRDRAACDKRARRRYGTKSAKKRSTRSKKGR